LRHPQQNVLYDVYAGGERVGTEDGTRSAMLHRSNEVWKRVTSLKKRVQLGNPKCRGMGCGKMGRSYDELASNVADNKGHTRDAGEESNVQGSK
jgi:hypothetical protein